MQMGLSWRSGGTGPSSREFEPMRLRHSALKLDILVGLEKGRCSHWHPVELRQPTRTPSVKSGPKSVCVYRVYPVVGKGLVDWVGW